MTLQVNLHAISTNGSSTVDLNIVSWDLYENVQHCPVKMSLTVGLTFDEVPIETKELIEQLFQYSGDGLYKCFKALESEHVQKRLLDEVSNNCKEDSDPNIAVSNFNNIIYGIFKNCLSPPKKNRNLFIKNMKRNAING